MTEVAAVAVAVAVAVTTTPTDHQTPDVASPSGTGYSVSTHEAASAASTASTINTYMKPSTPINPYGLDYPEPESTTNRSNQGGASATQAAQENVAQEKMGNSFLEGTHFPQTPLDPSSSCSLPWRFNAETNAATFFKDLQVPPKYKILLEDLSHANIAKKTGSKEEQVGKDNKLTRILKEGGFIVIKVGEYDPKGLLVWNTIEAFHKGEVELKGIGPDTIVSENCRFIFVGENITQQGSDFVSRGLTWKDSYIPELMQVKSTAGKNTVGDSSVPAETPVIKVTQTNETNPPTNSTTLDLEYRTPTEWKEFLKQGTIEKGVIKSPNLEWLHSTPVPNTLYFKGVAPESIEQFPEKLKKYLAKLGIKEVVILSEKTQPWPQQQDALPSEQTMRADKTLLTQLFNSSYVDEEKQLSLVNSLSNTKTPLHLHIVSDIPEYQWYQLKQICCSEGAQIRVSKANSVNSPQEIPVMDISENNKSEKSKKNTPAANLSISMVIPREQNIIFDNITQENQASNTNTLGEFITRPHALISALQEGRTVNLFVEDPQTISTELHNLCQTPPIACINGRIVPLKGQVIIKSLNELAKEDHVFEKSNEDISSLEMHNDYYKKQLGKCLVQSNFAKVHGRFASGKSHLASTLERVHHLSPLSSTTSSEDILKDKEFIKWARAKEGGILVIDEYNLAPEGVFDFLKGSFDVDGKFVTLNDTHKVVFLGNGMNEPGRNPHASLGCVVLNIDNPEISHVVEHFSKDAHQISDKNKIGLKSQYDTVENVKSLRDIQTYCELRKQNIDHTTALSFVFEPNTKLGDLNTTINVFLKYIDEKPKEGKRLLYVTGEPGIGKDFAIKEALKHRAVTHTTFGTHMDIVDFQRNIDAAYENESVMVISELSAAPTAVLEYMNNALAKPRQTKFCVIATDNEGFKGREKLSGPLQSRMTPKRVEPPTESAFKASFPRYNDQLIGFHYFLKDQKKYDVVCRHLHNAHQKMQDGDTIEEAIQAVYGIYYSDILNLYNNFLFPYRMKEANISIPTQKTFCNLYKVNSNVTTVTKDVVIGKSPDVCYGFLARAFYDINGKEIKESPTIFSENHQEETNIAPVAVHWIQESTTKIYPCLRFTRPPPSPLNPINLDLNEFINQLYESNEDNPINFAQQLAAYFKDNFKYTIDKSVDNQLKSLLNLVTSTEGCNFTIVK
jgi:hypothetical protein